jgi:hypothetical protein
MKTSYYFTCKKCGGNHEVDAMTFESHTTPDSRAQMAQYGAIEQARLLFEDGCPLCLPQNTTHHRVATLQVLPVEPVVTSRSDI